MPWTSSCRVSAVCLICLLSHRSSLPLLQTQPCYLRVTGTYGTCTCSAPEPAYSSFSSHLPHSHFWSFSIPVLSCSPVVSITGIIWVKVGTWALPSRVYLAPITHLHIQRAVFKLEGEGMKRREHCSSLHTASILPRISRENWMLRKRLERRGEERKREGESIFI